MQIAILDWLVLSCYLVLIAAVGIFAGLKVRDSEQYFLGKRRFGKWLMIGQSFGVGTHADMPVSLYGAVYGIGASGIWFQWKNLFATPFFWLMAPIFRRVRRTTMAEVTEDRYGRWMGDIYTVFALLFFTINIANMLKGAAKVIRQASGGLVPVDQIIVVMTVIFVVYSFVGGLVASAWADFFQGFLILVLSFLLIPLGWNVVGGLGGMRTTLDASMFSLATPSGVTPWAIAMLTLNGLIGVAAMPHTLAMVGTGKDEKTCRIGYLYGMFTKRFCTIGWAVGGLMVAALVAKGTFGVRSLADPEDAFGFGCRHLLFPGGLGLLIASVLAANMSCCSALMVDSGALFTQGFYRKYVAPNRADSYYLWAGRFGGLVVTLLAVLYAVFIVQRVLYSFLLTETMATFMGISVLGGIIWRRATRWGALGSLVASTGTNFLLYWVRRERLDNWEPNVFLAALGAGVVGLVAVSLLTRPEPEAAVAEFCRRLQTSTDATSAGGDRLLLVDLLHLRGAPPGAYRTDLTGLGVGWLIALALVAGTWVLFHI
jgi:Na+/proline symporter